MRFRTTLVLAIVAAALVALYVVIDVLPRTRLIGTDERMMEGGAVFAGRPFTRGEGPTRATLRTLITRLVLERGGETVEIERVAQPPEERWRFTKPIRAEASPGDVGMMCYTLEAISKERVIEPKPGETLDLAQYGLDKPTVTVTFTVESEAGIPTTHKLLIGDVDPVGRVRYVKRPDIDAVFGVSAKYLLPLGRSVAELRDRRLVTVNVADAERITLQRLGRPRTVMVRSGERWRLREPYAAGVDDLLVEQLLLALKEKRVDVDGLVADAPISLKPYGLAKPAVRISIDTKDRTQALLIGKEDPESGAVFAMREGSSSVFKLPAETVEKLTPGLRSLHVGRALDFLWEDADSLQLDIPGETIALKREGENWRLAKPVERDAEDVQVREFLKRAASLEIKQWVDDADDLKPLGLDPAIADVTIGLKGGGKRLLTIGRPVPEKDEFYARAGEGGPVVTLNADFLKELQAGYLQFISRRIVAFPEEKARRVIIERDGLTFETERTEGGWVLTKPAHLAVDPEAMRKLLWKISFISAVRYVGPADEDLADYGLADPPIKMAVVYAKGAGKRERVETEVIYFGKAAGDKTIYARLGNGDFVFTVNQDLIAALQSQVASRTICALPSTGVTAVTFRPAAGAEQRFERKDGRWADDDDLNRRVALLVTIGANLKAEDIVAWTRTRDAEFGIKEPRATVTLHFGAMGVELKVGAEAAGGGAYLASGAPMVYRVAEGAARVLMLQPLSDATAPKTEGEK